MGPRSRCQAIRRGHGPGGCAAGVVGGVITALMLDQFFAAPWVLGALTVNRLAKNNSHHDDPNRNGNVLPQNDSKPSHASGPVNDTPTKEAGTNAAATTRLK